MYRDVSWLYANKIPGKMIQPLNRVQRYTFRQAKATPHIWGDQWTSLATLIWITKHFSRSYQWARRLEALTCTKSLLWCERITALLVWLIMSATCAKHKRNLSRDSAIEWRNQQLPHYFRSVRKYVQFLGRFLDDLVWCQWTWVYWNHSNWLDASNFTVYFLISFPF